MTKMLVCFAFFLSVVTAHAQTGRLFQEIFSNRGMIGATRVLEGSAGTAHPVHRGGLTGWSRMGSDRLGVYVVGASRSVVSVGSRAVQIGGQNRHALVIRISTLGNTPDAVPATRFRELFDATLDVPYVWKEGDGIASAEIVIAPHVVRQVDIGTLGEFLNRSQRLRARAPGAPARLSAITAIARNLEATRSRIMAVSFSRVPYEDRILDYISDPALRRGFVAGLAHLQSKHRIANYVVALQSDTYQRMLAAGGALANQARLGTLDALTMKQVLLERARQQGVRVITLTEGLSSREFNRQIGRGFVLDEGFTASGSHGVWTHLLQQDMIYGTIAQGAGKNIDDVVEFFGTPAGMRVWDDMFDGGGQTPLCPEFFKPNFMRPNIPLGDVGQQRHLNLA